jgi:predicted SprT family Zn-dependent metalloprotease
MKIEKRQAVKAAEAKLVEKLTKRCLREITKKKWELGELPVSYTRAQERMEKIIVNCSGKGSYGCARYISIDVSHYRAGNLYFTEYATVRDDPTIGARLFSTPEGALAALVAHEVAHHVQYRYGPVTRWLKKKYRKPHGEGWQAIYRILRREVVNGME